VSGLQMRRAVFITAGSRQRSSPTFSASRSGCYERPTDRQGL